MVQAATRADSPTRAHSGPVGHRGDHRYQPVTADSLKAAAPGLTTCPGRLYRLKGRVGPDPRNGQLPTPAEVVDSVFDFAAQLLDA
jgi:hypothetical protein